MKRIWLFIIIIPIALPAIVAGAWFAYVCYEKHRIENLPPVIRDDDSPTYWGMAVQIHTNDKPVETFCPLFDEIADLGSNAVMISMPLFMENASSQNIFMESRKIPDTDDLIDLIEAAHARGLKTVIMPMVLLKNPGRGEWRGKIVPPDWNQWWRDYRDVIGMLAETCNKANAEAFIVGSELVKTESQTAEWVKTIEHVRGKFDGQLGYSANWDTYENVQFWDKLDFVGMTSYFRLAIRSNPPIEDLVLKWRGIQFDILEWQKTCGKPIVLTEVGWCSQEGAAREPWNYYLQQKATARGREEQRRLYEAFVTVWDATPAVAGVIWWEWTPGDGGDDDFTYTPKNKPAEKVLREWFATLKSRNSNNSTPKSTKPEKKK